MSENKFIKEKAELTPDSGFNLVAIDYFAEHGNQLYLVKHFERYQDALRAKKDKKIQEDYFILYKGVGGELYSR